MRQHLVRSSVQFAFMEGTRGIHPDAVSLQSRCLLTFCRHVPQKTHGEGCLPCARNMAHGKLNFCRAGGCRQRFAVNHPRRRFRCVPGRLRRVLGAHGEVSKSGSESFLDNFYNCCIGKQSFLTETIDVLLLSFYHSSQKNFCLLL